MGDNKEYQKQFQHQCHASPYDSPEHFIPNLYPIQLGMISNIASTPSWEYQKKEDKEVKETENINISTNKNTNTNTKRKTPLIQLRMSAGGLIAFIELPCIEEFTPLLKRIFPETPIYIGFERV